MYTLCWTRVDDRLIHGQVAVAWRQHLRYQEIWVVDAATRSDPFLVDALRLAAPPGVTVRVYGAWEVDVTRAPWSDIARGSRPLESPERSNGARVLLLVKQPRVVLALLDRGVRIDRLNVGNLSSSPGSLRVHKNVSLAEDDARALDVIAGRGVKIVFQLVPRERPVQWRVVRQKLDDRGRWA